MYAKRTTVPVERTRAQVVTMLERAHASRIMVAHDADSAMIAFAMSDRLLRFKVTLPPATQEQRRRQRWRALLLALKAKLECVESGIETFDEAFLAHVVVGARGETVGEHLIPQLTQLAQDKGVPQLPGW